MKNNKIYKNIHWLEFIVALLILTLTGTGAMTALLLSVLFVVIKSILIKFNKIPYTIDTNPIKTLGATMSASMLKFILTLIF